MTWAAVPGATAYEVVVRRTVSPSWEMVIPVGNVTQYDLRRRADDEYFGVRAVGANGHRSLISSYPAPPPPDGQGRQGGQGARRGGGPPPRDTIQTARR
jgi:hypothetical protein